VNMKQVGAVFGLVFAVTLAIFVGQRMSAEAMAVVVGVVCGVAASIPTGVLLAVALTRRDRRPKEEVEQYRQQGSYPPVLVIQGGAPQALPQAPHAGYWPVPQPGQLVPRQFHVVGGDEWLLDDRDF
jgi:ABC-type phosphate/phosphonate transport system permease subunit